jgi:hypothetical protein
MPANIELTGSQEKYFIGLTIYITIFVGYISYEVVN